MEDRLKLIANLLRLIGVILFLGVGAFAILIAGFAVDTPGNGMLAFLEAIFGVLAVTAPLWGIPWWAAHRISAQGVAGSLPALLYAFLLVLIFPLGTLLGAWLLYLLIRVRRAAQVQEPSP